MVTTYLLAYSETLSNWTYIWESHGNLTPDISPGIAAKQRLCLSQPWTERMLSKIHNMNFSSSWQFYSPANTTLYDCTVRLQVLEKMQQEQNYTEKHMIDNVVMVNTEIFPSTNICFTRFLKKMLPNAQIQITGSSGSLN